MSITTHAPARKPLEDNTMAEMVELVAASYLSRADDNGPTRLIGQTLARLATEIRCTHAQTADDFEDRQAQYDRWQAEKMAQRDAEAASQWGARPLPDDEPYDA